MEIFLDRLLSGLTNGSAYSLFAVALVVLYRGSRTINFAQAEFGLFSAYLAWWFWDQGLAIGWALVAATLGGFVLGVVVERLLIRPFGEDSEAAVLIVILALFVGMNGLDGWLFGSADKTFPSVLPDGEGSYFTIAGSRIHHDSLLLILVMVTVIGLIQALMHRTDLGLQMRSVASNRESAALCGVNVGRVLAVSWGIASMLGAFAGILIIPMLPPYALSLGAFFPLLILASAAALLGGLDSIGGAALGGILIGVGDAMLNGYVTFLGGSLHLTMAFVLIVLVLLIRPTGLFGTQRMERV